jgi:hypothetical protein
VELKHHNSEALICAGELALFAIRNTFCRQNKTPQTVFGVVGRLLAALARAASSRLEPFGK